MIIRMSESAPPAPDHPLVSGLDLRGSLGHWSSRQLARSWRRSIRLVRRGLDLPTPQRSAGVWAVAMVRNESDIIATTVRHLLDQDVARVLVVDNGSTDDTLEVLRAVKDHRLVVGHDREPGYYQAAKMSELAQWAGRHGADWVVPFDADELWSARGTTLGRHLASCPAVVARADVHNAFCSQEPDDWRVERRPDPMRKVAFRPHPLAILDTGNHWVSRPGDV
ncbi:glycosyltransferase family 2 protein, partial [Nocardioides sp.]|uniref:glycosyltransferase family 2 protein n=1 Tax=Nocardioides sp. TaxID=35761 RepID=UPI00286DA415